MALDRAQDKQERRPNYKYQDLVHTSFAQVSEMFQIMLCQTDHTTVNTFEDPRILKIRIQDYPRGNINIFLKIRKKRKK